MENNVKTNKPETKKMKGSTKIRIFSLLLAGILVFGAIAFAGCESSKTSKELETAIDEQAAALAAANAALEKAIADAKADSKASSDALEQALADAQAASTAAQAALEAAIAKAVEDAQKAWNDDWAEATEKRETSAETLQKHYNDAFAAMYDHALAGETPDVTYYHLTGTKEPASKESDKPVKEYVVNIAFENAKYNLYRAVSLDDAAKVIAAFDDVVKKETDATDLQRVYDILEAVDKAIKETKEAWDETEDKSKLEEDVKNELYYMSLNLEAARKLFDGIKFDTVTAKDKDKKEITVADVKAKLAALEATYNSVYKKDVTEIRDENGAKFFNADMKDILGKITTKGYVSFTSHAELLKACKDEYDTLTANAKAKVDTTLYPDFEKALKRLAVLDEARTAAGVAVEGKYPAGTINAMIAECEDTFGDESKKTWTEKQTQIELIEKAIEAWKKAYIEDAEKETENLGLVKPIEVYKSKIKAAQDAIVGTKDKVGIAQDFIENVTALDKVTLLSYQNLEVINSVLNTTINDKDNGLKAKGYYDLTFKLDEKGNTLTTYLTILKAARTEYAALQKEATVALLEAFDQYEALIHGSTEGTAKLALDTWLETYGVWKEEYKYATKEDGSLADYIGDEPKKIELKKDNPKTEEVELVQVYKDNKTGKETFDAKTDGKDNEKLYVMVTLIDMRNGGYKLDYATVVKAVSDAQAALDKVIAKKPADTASDAEKEAYNTAKNAAEDYLNDLKGILINGSESYLTYGEVYGWSLNETTDVVEEVSYKPYTRRTDYTGKKFDLATAQFYNAINYYTNDTAAIDGINASVFATIRTTSEKNIDFANALLNAVRDVHSTYKKNIGKVEGFDAETLTSTHDDFMTNIVNGTIDADNLKTTLEDTIKSLTVKD